MKAVVGSVLKASVLKPGAATIDTDEGDEDGGDTGDEEDYDIHRDDDVEEDVVQQQPSSPFSKNSIQMVRDMFDDNMRQEMVDIQFIDTCGVMLKVVDTSGDNLSAGKGTTTWFDLATIFDSDDFYFAKVEWLTEMATATTLPSSLCNSWIDDNHDWPWSYVTPLRVT